MSDYVANDVVWTTQLMDDVIIDDMDILHVKRITRSRSSKYKYSLCNIKSDKHCINYQVNPSTLISYSTMY
jgi:hypothetical protein